MAVDWARAYARFRGSRNFLLGLAAFIAAGLAAHFVLGWDADFGALNLLLSMEASLSVALLMMWNERQDEAEAKRLEYLVHLMEAVRDGLVVARGLDARNAGGGVAAPEPPPQD